MKRTEWLQETRKMRFEEAYKEGGDALRKLTNPLIQPEVIDPGNCFAQCRSMLVPVASDVRHRI